MTRDMKIRMWKPPPRRDYHPKPLSPGQPVTWQHEIPGRWTGPSWGSGEWIPGETVTRAGTVWSDGPVPGSRWVIPDDAPEDGPVAVRIPSPKDWRHRSNYQLPSYPPGWARDAVRRAEHVRRHGDLFAVMDEVTEDCGWSYPQPRTWKTLSWHCDPDCPAVAGKERDPGSQPWPVREVVAIVIGERHPAVSPRFCNQCVYLDDTAADAA